MKTYGLTGGIGMGKSTAAQILDDCRIPVIDTDDLARQIVQPGETALQEIQQAFGSGILSSDGNLRRHQLADIVFSDDAARKKLEAITHPRIAGLWRRQLTIWQDGGKATAVVVIPLLYETEVEAEFDEVVCVACSEVTQRERLLARGWTSEQIRLRLAAQLPAAEKMARANYVVWTEGEIAEIARQLAKIIPA